MLVCISYWTRQKKKRREGESVMSEFEDKVQKKEGKTGD